MGRRIGLLRIQFGHVKRKRKVAAVLTHIVDQVLRCPGKRAVENIGVNQTAPGKREVNHRFPGNNIDRDRIFGSAKIALHLPDVLAFHVDIRVFSKRIHRLRGQKLCRFVAG